MFLGRSLIGTWLTTTLKYNLFSCSLPISRYVQNGWHKLSDVQHFVLPADTLVYGEIVEETQGEGKSQMKYFAFHIIDGLFLGGEDIRNRNLDERLT